MSTETQNEVFFLFDSNYCGDSKRSSWDK